MNITRSQKEVINKYLLRLFESTGENPSSAHSGASPAPARSSGSGSNGPGQPSGSRRGDDGRGSARVTGRNQASHSPALPGSMVGDILKLWKVIEQDLASRYGETEVQKGMNYVARATLSGVQKVPDLRDHPEARRFRQRVENLLKLVYRKTSREHWETLSRLVERQWRPNQITYPEAVYFLEWLRRLLPEQVSSQDTRQTRRR
ncbi:hypothetical protein [Kyrpidia spormannii]|uniref:Uncharacterized protein n=2 Tax=Kyrpidia spormannii TaxID=2055160 RepID=A0A6F9EDK0_9BACL|nr:hypothetical protein [Kyrpidia spormannii]CAB3394568.1 conserved protein of unknown function [Kyrpidia spormannii]CAB3395501.1 conserved protein of unknown function [Kyrpidia spormannii]